MNTGLTDFVMELIIRLFSKTPWFFKVVRILGIAVGAITGLPVFLASIGISIPTAWDAVSSKVIAIAALVGTFIAQMTVTTDVKDKEKLKD